jgi:hypothetical protein
MLSTANYDIGQFYYTGVGTSGWYSEESNLIVNATEDEDCASSIKGLNLDVRLSVQSRTIGSVNSGNVFQPMMLEFDIDGNNLGDYASAKEQGDHVIQILGCTLTNMITSYSYMDVLAQEVVNIESGKTNHVTIGFLPSAQYAAIIVTVSGRGTNMLSLYKSMKNIKLYTLTERIYAEFQSSDISFVKVGIQGSPGTVFILNGSKFIIGKTGVFELYNRNVEIYSLGFKVVEGNPFIVTYKYLPLTQS